MDPYGANARLRYLRTALGLRQHDLAHHLGLTQSAISQLLANKTRLSIETLLRISDAFRVDLNWLMLGEGRPFRESGLPRLPAQPALLAVTLQSMGDAVISVVPRHQQAEYARRRLDEAYWQGLPQLHLPGPIYRDGIWRAFEIADQALEPTLSVGDVVICRCVDDWRWLRPLELYVVVVGGAILIRRVASRLRDLGRLYLLAESSVYPAIELHETDLVEVWSVEAHLSHRLGLPADASHFAAWRTEPPPPVPG